MGPGDAVSGTQTAATVSIEAGKSAPGVLATPHGFGSEPDAAAISAGHGPAPGGHVGRYTLGRHLGSGNMGDVYAAHDPDLNRQVAIKLIRPGLTNRSPNARVRFHREAQALARLNHPNIVAIYDVGVIGDGLFVAMELVHGQTLAAWLAERPRELRDIVEVLAQAGRGLAAAHAAGITHRDFKPSNVMLGDRVRVVDFGVARAADDELGEFESSAPVLSTLVTATGDRVGTPAYMAPEQHRHATGLSDQYSFAVALHEAVMGVRPGGAVPVVPSRHVPPRLRALLARALQVEPEARFPSMDELLAELQAVVPAPRSAWRWIAAAIAAGSLAVTAAAIMWSGASTIDPCAATPGRLRAVWDGPRKNAVHGAFAAVALSSTEDVWRAVSRQLDDYTERWTALASEACRATRVEGRQSVAMLDLRMQCLERRRAVLGELTGLWSRGVDAETLVRAVDAARGLPALADCADLRGLGERVALPTEPGQASRIAAVRGKLDQLAALVAARRWADAKRAISGVRPDADATAWPVVQAEAAFADGQVLSSLNEPGAEPALRDAVRLAGVAHDDRLVARALTELAQHLAYAQQDSARALLVADVAAGAVARAGDDDELRARLLEGRVDALYTAARYDEARTVLLEARGHTGPEAGWTDTQLGAIATTTGDYAAGHKLLLDGLAAATAELGPQHPRVAQVLSELGRNRDAADDPEASVRYYRRSLDLMRQVFGAEAAPTANTMNNLAGPEATLGHLDAAASLLEQALAIRERVLGPDHSFVAMTLGNLAEVRRKQGRLAEAQTLAERALAMSIKRDGPEHPSVAYKLGELATIAWAKDDHSAALGYYQRAAEIQRKALGADHPMTLHSITNVADELAALHRCGEAVPMITAVISGLEKAPNAERGDLAGALRVTAECDLEQGHAVRAVAGLQRALVIAEEAKADPAERGAFHWPLARALWATGRRDEALTTARTAAQELATDAQSEHMQADVRAWLAARSAGR